MKKACNLFAGIDGIDLAFQQAKFEIVWANESTKTYAKHTNTIFRHGIERTR